MKRFSAILIAVMFMIIGTHSVTHAMDWKSLNIEMVSRTENESQTIVILKDRQARTFKVIYQDEAMLAKLSNKIIKYKNEFYGWKNIRFNDITFMVFANFLNIIIIPQEVNVNGLNLAGAIPAGIAMAYDPEKDWVRYDFRITKDEEFIRIVGNYLHEDELVNRMAKTYDNPAGNLQSANPDPLQPANTDELNEKMVQALIYLNNQDWNGRQKTIPVETIRQVIKLRQSNPDATKAQLWKMVKKAKINVSKREYDLILVLCFNEFK
ncbi:MAG TPA: hypothetical protein DDW65_00540 [Firmicutes bacterium]|jgi:hypothetical protein|nr:hypothetical protein [Bacillota bacterium]